ncbi:hypothetical protein DENIT_50007 [Pseudomonas veronii]|nr:hypothetical protein DENIT_20199 [Pseudomonas veronii]CAD0265184.1 hypothetical protein DENIT_50007 [Pseudomonas veronii]
MGRGLTLSPSMSLTKDTTIDHQSVDARMLQARNYRTRMIAWGILDGKDHRSCRRLSSG